MLRLSRISGGRGDHFNSVIIGNTTVNFVDGKIVLRDFIAAAFGVKPNSTHCYIHRLDGLDLGSGTRFKGSAVTASKTDLKTCLVQWSQQGFHPNPKKVEHIMSGFSGRDRWFPE